MVLYECPRMNKNNAGVLHHQTFECGGEEADMPCVKIIAGWALGGEVFILLAHLYIRQDELLLWRHSIRRTSVLADEGCTSLSII